MSFKVKEPQEDAATKARREQAEAQAEKTKTGETQRSLDQLTQELLRTFGRRATLGGLGGYSPGAGGGASGGGGGSSGGTGDQSLARTGRGIEIPLIDLGTIGEGFGGRADARFAY